MNDELRVKNNELGGKMNYRYRTDEEMKDSGVEWLGSIPNEWNIKKLKYLAKIDTGNRDTQDKEENGIYPFFVRSDTIERSNTYSFDGEAVLTAGDGVGVAKVFHYINGKFAYHQRVYKISDFKQINGKYLYYYIKDNLGKEVEKISAKTTVDSLRLPMFLNFPVLINEDGGKKISEFLDKKTAQFDSIISKKEALIEKLEEAKKSLISEVVTGKVKVVKTNDGYELVERKKEEMKDSEISRIGSIPTYWNISKLKYVSNIIMGQSPDSSDVKDLGNTLFMQGSSEFGKMFPSPKMYCDNSNKVSRIGDILMSVRAPVGEVNISNKPYAIGRGLCSIKAVNISSGYLWYFMMKSKDDFRFYSNGTTFDAITINIINNFILTVPSKNEENMIVEFLNKETSKIENLVINIKTVIEKLKEAKQSLISEAVTGKIEILD